MFTKTCSVVLKNPVEVQDLLKPTTLTLEVTTSKLRFGSLNKNTSVWEFLNCAMVKLDPKVSLIYSMHTGHIFTYNRTKMFVCFPFPPLRMAGFLEIWCQTNEENTGVLHRPNCIWKSWASQKFNQKRPLQRHCVGWGHDIFALRVSWARSIRLGTPNLMASFVEFMILHYSMVRALLKGKGLRGLSGSSVISECRQKRISENNSMSSFFGEYSTLSHYLLQYELTAKTLQDCH